MKQPDVHHLHYDTHKITVWTVVGICIGSISLLAALAVLGYRCYQRRRMRNVQSRLSTAIKKGLQDPNIKRAPTSVRDTPMKHHKATSPILPPEAGPNDKLPQTPQHSLLPEKEPGNTGTEVFCENEKEQVQTPSEKDESQRERHVDEKEHKLGNIHFSVQYEPQKLAMMVNIKSISDLPPRDPSLGGCDPYIKLQLLPEKKHKCKTRVLRKTQNPVYDETFTFYGISENQLDGISLHFVVLSFDRFSRDEMIGEVVCPLQSVDITEKEVPLYKEINPRHLKLRCGGRGELLVSLCYQPAANRLTVVVLKARNLPKMDITGLSDPYVKIYLLYNNQRIAKKKTHVKKRTLNPVFNESFLFDVPYNEGLQNISLEFLLLDWDRMTKNEVIGRLDIGTRTTGQELHHWNEVMNCPRKQIAEWHKLRE
ncbi:hypothetical protein FSP39_001493 [Pinctada imbricata]|uniref:C2 domain-containing protein n=1 Tax=Pinctada imbricata TaxID=66713 RepID=A0AA89C6C2_PINIB|nr:hypothetical protein FSP39_001493 [Pinctada imbricata]